MAVALCGELVPGTPIGDADVRPWGTLAGSALLLAGVVVMAVGHRAGGARPATGPSRDGTVAGRTPEGT
ncbi:hypothetical protein [Streptomyces tropicalis]|uniref:hypothetical protein n=1 Tax=Streptomyces tropicalis TaxID=3034234 RepID=UPI0023E22495|nr:hypothetical protein [Streptomyces tropicalis]